MIRFARGSMRIVRDNLSIVELQTVNSALMCGIDCSYDISIIRVDDVYCTMKWADDDSLGVSPHAAGDAKIGGRGPLYGTVLEIQTSNTPINTRHDNRFTQRLNVLRSSLRVEDNRSVNFAKIVINQIKVAERRTFWVYRLFCCARRSHTRVELASLEMTRPFWPNWTCNAGPPCPANVCASCPVRTSKMRTLVSLEAVATTEESKAISWTEPWKIHKAIVQILNRKRANKNGYFVHREQECACRRQWWHPRHEQMNQHYQIQYELRWTW